MSYVNTDKTEVIGGVGQNPTMPTPPPEHPAESLGVLRQLLVFHDPERRHGDPAGERAPAKGRAVFTLVGNEGYKHVNCTKGLPVPSCQRAEYLALHNFWIANCQSALQSEIARSFGLFTPNWSENSKSLRTPIQNSPEFWSEKLHRVPLQIACSYN